jgi:hypothetical protein
MASIFKRRKGKNVPYTIQYIDHLGKRKTAQGFTDKGLTEQLAGKLESEARLRSSGMIAQNRTFLRKAAATISISTSWRSKKACAIIRKNTFVF